MNEIQHNKMQEDEAFGAFLIEAIAKGIGLPGETEVKRIDRAIYKGTDCGAWIRFDSEGIMVGTIVEGSDAEFSERISLDGVTLDEAGEKLVADRTFAALAEIEILADAAWHEANE